MTNLTRHLDAADIQGLVSIPGMDRAIKTPEQGAATTVWAAIGKQWKGCGGKYLEDCSVNEPFQAGATSPYAPGYAPHTYDLEEAKQLWELSSKLVGHD
ncbi:hypothetical protein ABBQ32_007576 [Trebouxia sp. C0010 RCD-2024]